MNVEHAYKVKNTLDEHILILINKRALNEGNKTTKKELYYEIANYCDVGWENIRRINRNVSQPSLAVALKISKYFDVPVEDIFKIF